MLNKLNNSFADINDFNGSVSSLSFNANDFIILNDIKNIKKENHINNHTFLFNTHKYLKEILISYSHNPEKILEQVEVDFCRTNVFFNNKRINGLNDFIMNNENFSNLVFETKIKRFTFLTILLMLCCQSSYGFHYMHLKDIYCDGSENNKNLLLCSSNENRHTSFIMEDDVLSIIIETNLIIKNTIDNTDVNKINTKVIIDLHLKGDKTNYIKFNEYGLFYWSILQ